MSGPRIIPDEARLKQARASDPAASVFVSANAGSGKTYVLVNRVIRLLLNDVSPEKILCVTFTKAAAANMAERVFSKLGHWVTLDDEALDIELKSVGIAHSGPSIRGRARELFACALETPGGLKVQTIHALCTRLLQQFPFEANVPARFSVLDDRDQNEMLERASLAILLQAAADPDSREGRALAIAMTSAADVTFRDVVREASLSRDKFLAWIDRAGNIDTALAQLSQALGVAPDDSVAAVDDEIVEGPNLPRQRWIMAAEVFETGGANDIKQGGRLRTALQRDGDEQIDAYLNVFFTGEMEPRKALAGKKLTESRPDLFAALGREADRIAPLLARRRAVAMRDRTQSLLVIASGVAANYRREKLERGLLDYDDLIDRTLALLDSGAASWVHYKLDRGVDHVLIDEAQDTSPRQWDIIAHLIAEFTAGEGARDGTKRTIFAVGDEKQSIFSFQGAAPREFDERRRALQTKFTGAGLAFDPIAFTYSFRTGKAILQSVDHTFRDEAIFRSIHNDTAYPVHESLVDAGPSLIDLWELQAPAESQELEGWQAPFDAVPETSPEVQLARRVQAEIKALIAGGTQTGPLGRRRPLSYGDMLILVRRRGKAFDAIIQALKQGGVPVAGADRLKLTEHIAVIDLMHLADALLLPQDDLALAVALKSPLFGLDDDDLFKLAYERKGTLRAALDDHANDPRIGAALQRLRACEKRFAGETPFSFYAWLLGGEGHGEGGRARMLRRLGHEANDALDEFLELALNYEQKAPASLQGFVAWLRAADTEVKRDMEISRDEVRVMTVHGAKGLEAPVVFLIDTTSSPADTQRLNLLHLPQGNAAPSGSGVVVWAGRKGDDPPMAAGARESALRDTEDEYRRLLYVAMTRAADRLIIGGCMPGNRNEVREHSWYDLMVKGLEGSGLAMQQVPPPDGKVKRYTRPEDIQPEPAAATQRMADAPAPSLPGWLRTAAPVEPRPEPSLRPSDAADDDRHRAKAGETSAQRTRALQRGTLIHRLLQSLPDTAPDQRGAAAARFLARNADKWTDDERAALTAEVLALLDAPRFKPLFAPGSRAEVTIAGRIAGGTGTLPVSGQIDRLVITPAEILIVDYKTNHNPPRHLSGVPTAYVRQLAAYRMVLAKLYSERPVRAALLWTETAEMMELSAAMLDAAEADITSARAALDPARERS